VTAPYSAEDPASGREMPMKRLAAVIPAFIFAAVLAVPTAPAQAGHHARYCFPHKHDWKCKKIKYPHPYPMKYHKMKPVKFKPMKFKPMKVK
jgi:hypothetical protein